MLVFKLPSWVTKKIDKIRKVFLWSCPDTQQSKIRLVSWMRICRLRKQGGWGILNLQNFNNALLGKWSWKITSSAHWCGEGIIRENYFKTCPEWNLFHKQYRRRSFFWNGILHSLHAFRKNLSPLVKNGATAFFWLDNWVEGNSRQTFGPIFSS